MLLSSPPGTRQLELDGFDIAWLQLKWLRAAIAMLPQDPILFSGTVSMRSAPKSAAGLRAWLRVMMRSACSYSALALKQLSFFRLWRSLV